MISLLPSFEETVVLPRNIQDPYQRLAASTSNKPFLQPDEEILLFAGWVRPDRFRISLRTRRPNYFLPLVIGRLEESSSGCILLLRYVLFPTTRILIQLWTVLVMLSSAMAGYSYHKPVLGLMGLVALVLVYLVAWANFRIQLRLTREAIQRVVA